MTEKSAVALGIFDGLHLGHRAVINHTLNCKGFVPCVFTFRTESLSFKHNKPFKYIYPNDFKMDMISSLGINQIYCPDFTDMKDMSGDDFAFHILKNKLNAGKVICGQRFRFGKDASCGIDELKSFGQKYGFDVECVSPISSGDRIVSSTFIRELLNQGHINTAKRMLGMPYTICDTVRYGRQIGRTIDFPTINQYFGENQLIIKYGVYASKALINGEWLPAVTNVGIKPTISENEKFPLAETHIINFNDDLYGKNVTVQLHSFLRSEKQFSSLEQLKEAIALNIRQAEKFIS